MTGLRILSLHQPYASALFVPHTRPDRAYPEWLKMDETRSWAQPRGFMDAPLLIHATAAMPRYADDFALEEYMAGRLPLPSSLPRGAIVGVVWFFGTIRSTGPDQWRKTWERTETQLSYGDYSEGRWIWHLSRERRFEFPEPRPVKGTQGLGYYFSSEDLPLPDWAKI